MRASSFAVALEELDQDPVARRDFLTRMGAALALAGLGACTRAPREEIVPYVVQPPEVRPGIPRHYATAFVLDGYATGIVVESHTGRPTKVEGNPEHPSSLGAAGIFEQASVLSLYDPARARGVKERGAPTTWDAVARALGEGPWANEAGRGLHLHLDPTSSPTTVELLTEIRRRHPHAAVSFRPTPAANAWEGARLAFGRVLEPRFAFDRADVVVALDADFLSKGSAALRHARHYADRRADGLRAGSTMNRLYVAEPLVTVTGTSADHRLRVSASRVRTIAAALAAAVHLPELPGGLPPALLGPGEPERRWIAAAARDLLAHRGRGLVVVGDAQPPEVHALAHAINTALGNMGTTVTFASSPIAEAGAHEPSALPAALAGGEVDTLVICGENPVYASPHGAELAALFARARQSVYLGAYEDETASACSFTVARAHGLESWGDARAFDGTLSIIQPLIEPLYGGRTELELLALFAGDSTSTPHDLVRSCFRRGSGPEGEAWRRALKRGVVDGTALPTHQPSIDWTRLAKELARVARVAAPRVGPERLENEIELLLRVDPHVHDGRFASNAWLLELPSPITKLTWTNAATLSPADATRLGLASGDEIELRSTQGGPAVRAPTCVVPGQADGTVGLTLGWGRWRGAELAHGRGANGFVLASGARLDPVAVTIAKTGVKHVLPITQTQRRLVGRDHEILRHATVDERGAPEGRAKRRLTLYEREPGPSPWQWGMAIDLTRCTGCGACVVACQAENNVPTVGPDNVLLNREMHWLRIDSYVLDDEASPRFGVQPMLCQHCESAPCEYVCPVNATVHSPDGLNEMVYNRCVGTRFCSNNCPYKVRRFNWFDFHRTESATEQLVHNPDVSVRERGVMEKCTFCVQRLREWEIKRQAGRPSPHPRTACQQTCPTQAIVFGDLREHSSEVKRLHDDARAYAVLDELGTEPRVRYLARVMNPNPELT